MSLFSVSLLHGERLFTEGLLPICWDNKSSSKLRDVAIYMCGHMIKTALFSFIEDKGGFTVILKYKHWHSKNFLTSPSGRKVLFIKDGKMYLLKLSLTFRRKKTSLNTPGCLILHIGLTSGRRTHLFTLPYCFSRFFVKLIILGCTLILITALVT